MPRISFTANIQRHVNCEAAQVSGDTLATALDHYFQHQPQARGYVLDDQGGLRHHMVIYINQQPLQDRKHLSDPVAADDDIFVFQALSGG